MHDKTKKPLIGITAGTLPNDVHEWGPTAVGQLNTYVEAVVAGGGVPMILPLCLDDEVIRLLVETCDGFLLAGGTDIDPTHFGEKNQFSEDIDQVRDAFELRLVARVTKTDKPILGICRGMQLLNIARGGTLYQDIKTQLPGSLDHQHAKTIQDYTVLSHDLSIDSGTRLGQALDVGAIKTNSQHHQAIKELGENLVVSTRASDGIIEGIEDPTKPFVVGVQSHPEALFSTTEHRWSALFEQFVAACRGYYNFDSPASVLVSSNDIELDPAQTTALVS